MEKIIEELRADAASIQSSWPQVHNGAIKAADKLDQLREFLQMVEDPKTAPSSEWVARHARELLA